MDFGKAFTFMFEDPDWLRKLGIGTLVGLVGIIFSPVLIGLIPLIMLFGYSLDVLRNVMDGKQYPLPEWEDWGGFLVRGLKIIGVSIVWALPLIVVAIPFGIGAALSDNSGSAANAIGALFMICGGCLSLLWALFLWLVTPAIYIRLARTDRFCSAFELGKIWALTRDNFANVIIALILLIVAGIIAAVLGMLGFIALVIGILVSIPFANLWWYLVQAHLFGQIGANSVTAVE